MVCLVRGRKSESQRTRRKGENMGRMAAGFWQVLKKSGWALRRRGPGLFVGLYPTLPPQGKSGVLAQLEVELPAKGKGEGGRVYVPLIAQVRRWMGHPNFTSPPCPAMKLPVEDGAPGSGVGYQVGVRRRR